jgi:hypothetical protein
MRSTSPLGSSHKARKVRAPSPPPVLVRLGTDNLVQSDPPVYRKLWVAIVTDVAGHPIAGVTVNFSLRSGKFLKGAFFKPPVSDPDQTWHFPTPTTCPNEDTNNNGILDSGEDINGNGLLDSLGHSSVITTDVSDASGVARTTLVYPKNAAFWSELTLVGGSGVGTPATATFFLEGLASDYADLTISPPGATSPFGAGGSCANTL